MAMTPAVISDAANPALGEIGHLVLPPVEFSAHGATKSIGRPLPQARKNRLVPSGASTNCFCRGFSEPGRAFILGPPALASVTAGKLIPATKAPMDLNRLRLLIATLRDQYLEKKKQRP